MVMSDFSPEVEIRPFRACAIHPVIIIVTIRFFGHCGLGYEADTTFHRMHF